jgi:phenylacetate-CoA ligase
MAVRPDIFASRLIRVQRDQWLSRDELAARQWQRFKIMLDYAAAHSPFYRRKFSRAGLLPDDIRDRDDLSSIPLTTRDELESSTALITDSHDRKTLHESASSGSTGQNVRSYFNDEAWLIGKYLLKIRARLACGVRPSDRIAMIRIGTSHNGPLAEIALRQRSFSVEDSLEETLARLNRYSPTVLQGFPEHFARLARHAEQLPTVKRIFTSGEMLSDNTRETIETSFGVPIYDIYGCTEVKEIAWECPEQDGYHINSDQLLVETLPSAGPQDPEGMLAVTSLYNFAMPLIRYRLGDTGRLIDGQCACGRGLPMMAPEFGRSMDYFQLPDDRHVSPYTLSGAVEQVSRVRQFQVWQTQRDEVVVKVVPSGGRDPALPQRLQAALQPLLPGVSVKMDWVDEIPREPNGKYRKVISLVSQGSV